MRVISGNAPYGDGGMGRHLASVVEDARRTHELTRYFCISVRPNDPAGVVVDLSRYRWLTRGALRWAPHGWRDFAANEVFDRAVARRLAAESADADEVVAFAGAALRTFAKVAEQRSARLVLESATSHVDNVARRHRDAAAAGVHERSWLTPLHVRKARREYRVADAIVVSSEYARQSFIEAGVDPHKLVRRVQEIPARFAPPATRRPSDVFTVVYVGRLELTKGVAVLLDAVAQLPDPDLRLVLVGRFSSSSMQRFVAGRSAADPRISVTAGDPLAHLHRADALVHPSFEDGLALAPLEALATGVPVVVSEDTGMKEYVEEGKNGFVVPTGDVHALVAALRGLMDRPLTGVHERSLLPDALRGATSA